MTRENPLFEKAKAFALRIVKVYRYLKKNGETIMSKQLLRSGTSIGANIAEAQYAQSKADFVLKLSIALKETSETLYWIELLKDADCLPGSPRVSSLQQDCSELLCMLISSVKTSKK